MPINCVPADWCQSAGTGVSTPIGTTITMLGCDWTVSNQTATTMTFTLAGNWANDRMLDGYSYALPTPAPEPCPAPPAPNIPPDVVQHVINRWAELRADRAAADARAEELLGMMLSGQQLADRAVHGWFEVTGSAGGRYRIYRHVTGNVHQLSTFEINGEVREVASLCAHPPLEVPHGDVHLAQMLALTTDEVAFREVANISMLH